LLVLAQKRLLACTSGAPLEVIESPRSWPVKRLFQARSATRLKGSCSMRTPALPLTAWPTKLLLASSTSSGVFVGLEVGSMRKRWVAP